MKNSYRVYMRSILLAFTAYVAQASTAYDTPPLDSLSLAQLEQRLSDIETELTTLSHYSLRSGIGSIGYRSRACKEQKTTEWVQINLTHEAFIDEIILAPTVSRDSNKGFQADAFPSGFEVYTGMEKDTQGTLQATFKPTDQLLPRIAPLIIPIKKQKASWVRIESSHLTLRGFNHLYVMQLSEIMVFSGEKNVALHQPVSTSSNVASIGGAWDKRFLVDGYVPYLMDCAQGPQSPAYVSGLNDHPTLVIDLEDSYALSSIHLHAIDSSDTAPRAFDSTLGIPRHLRIEGALNPDFVHPVLLLDFNHWSILDVGPIMMWNIPPTKCRYVRVYDAGTAAPDSRIGFAEIELLCEDHNVALHKMASVLKKGAPTHRIPAALTDGANLYGKILPIRTWMHELVRRQELETELPLVVHELDKRYKNQKKNLHRVSWLAALLTGGIGFTLLLSRLLQMRQADRMKTRFAADIHDELGANLHAIGLLGDMAKEAVHSPDRLIKTVDKIRALTERSGEAARYCAEMQQSEIFGKLPDDMRRTANRIMTDLAYTLTIAEEEKLDQLAPRAKADLFLFYKECLINISRHAEAKKVDISLSVQNKQITLIISDDGQGLSGQVPASLKRRARLLGGQIATSTTANGGTRIALSLKLKKIRLKK